MRRGFSLRQALCGAKDDQPEYEPRARNARKGEDRAVDGSIIEAKKEEQVKARKRVEGGKDPDQRKEGAADESREFHDRSM